MNTDTPMETVLTRLDAVERANRRMKIVGAVVLVLVGAGLLMAQAKPGKRVVEAEKFVLKGEDGKTRGQWLVNPRGVMKLMLQDKDETPRGEWNVELNGTTRLFLHGKAGTPQVVLVAHQSGMSSVSLFDQNGPRGFWDMGSDGSLSLTLYDKDANSRAVLGTTEFLTTSTGTKVTTSESSLVLYDKAGKVIFQAP